MQFAKLPVEFVLQQHEPSKCVYLEGLKEIKVQRKLKTKMRIIDLKIKQP